MASQVLVFFCLFAAILGCNGSYNINATDFDIDINRIPPNLMTFGQGALSRGISILLLKVLEAGHFPFENLDEKDSGPMVTFPVDLPPFPDPINLLPLEITIPDIDLQPALFLNGFVATCEPKLEGLSQMDEEHLVLGYSLVTTEALVDLSYRFTGFAANSRYLTNIYFNYTDAVDSGEFTFSSPQDGGLAAFGFNNLSLLLKAKGMLPIQLGRDRMSLDELDFDFDYSDFVLLMSSLHLDGNEVGDLDLGSILGPILKLLWGQLRVGVVESVRCQLDHAINDCVLLDLIGGAFGCLKLEMHAPCYPETPNATDISVVSLLEALEEIKLTQGTLGYCVPDQETSPAPTDETAQPTTTTTTTTTSSPPPTTTSTTPPTSTTEGDTTTTTTTTTPSTTPEETTTTSSTTAEEDTTTTTTTPAPTTSTSTEPPQTTAGAPKGVDIWLLPIFLISAMYGVFNM